MKKILALYFNEKKPLITMDNYNHLIKKSIIPVLLIFLGIYLLIVGFENIKNYEEPQELSFIYGAFSSLLMGIFIFIINFELINNRIIKKITLPVSLIILLPFAGHLSYSIYDSINTTIEEMDQKKKYDSHIQQGLIDIKDIQSEYKKIYRLYSNDYNELKRFLLEDKAKLISLTVPNGLNEDSVYNLIDMKISPEHQVILKYDSTDINDWKKITDGYSDEEALKCKLLIRDTIETDILKKLFPEDLAEKNRVYPFDINNFQNVPSLDFHKSGNNQFLLKTEIYDKIGSSRYFFLYYDKNNHRFTSNHLINSNKKLHYLNNREGLFLTTPKNFVSLLKNHSENISFEYKNVSKGDFLTSINNTKLESPNDIVNILSECKLNDTISFEFAKYPRSNNSKVATNTSSTVILKFKTVFMILNELESCFASSFYDSKNYTLIPIETKFLNATDENNVHPIKTGMYIDTASIKNILANKSIFNGAEFEYEKGKYYSINDSITDPIQIFTRTKIGTPVFLAEDPYPYDPFSKCPLPWKIGSLKEIKTNGNWD